MSKKQEKGKDNRAQKYPKIHKHRGTFIIAGFSVLAAILSIATIADFKYFDLSSSSNAVVPNVQSSTTDPDVLGTASSNAEVSILKKSTENLDDTRQKISLDVQIKNSSSQVLQISPLLQMQLIGSDQKSYSMTAEFIGDKILGGPIDQQGIFRETIDFVMPAGTQPQYFLFTNAEPYIKERIDLPPS